MNRVPGPAASSPIPARAGIGFKPAHYVDVLAQAPAHLWFEVHPENYLVAGGPLHAALTRVRERHALSFHSVGMSLGSGDGIDANHIHQLRALCERYQPALVSDHLAWCRVDGNYLNDLLPVPFSQAALRQFCNNVDRVQHLLGRTIAIENPSSYVRLQGADMDECDFLVEACRRTGAGILLDVNNLYVSARNIGLDANDYLARIPSALVQEMHLAGHAIDAGGTLLIDDHGSAVTDAVWALYRSALACIGPRPTLIEWDTRVPAFAVLAAEAARADAVLLDHTGAAPLQSVRHG